MSYLKFKEIMEAWKEDPSKKPRITLCYKDEVSNMRFLPVSYMPLFELNPNDAQSLFYSYAYLEKEDKVKEVEWLELQKEHLNSLLDETSRKLDEIDEQQRNIKNGV